MGTDFYPTGMVPRAAWHGNYAANIGPLAAKYNITAAQLAAIEADNTWMQFWVRKRSAAATFASQLAAYFNTIAGADPTRDPPLTPAFTLADFPDEVPPGIEARVREIARQIKGHSSYSEADGARLGIVGEGGLSGASVIKPTIKTQAAVTGYQFSISVARRGLADSWQVWAMRPGISAWQLLATATGRSVDVKYQPPDEERSSAIQLNVRVQLRRRNADYGEVSNSTYVTVNP